MRTLINHTNEIYKTHTIQVDQPTVVREPIGYRSRNGQIQKGGRNMTNNSIQFMKNLETQRHDEAMEQETNRNNLILEAIKQKEYEETARANRASEAIRTAQNALESRNLDLTERDLVRKGKDSAVQRKATKQSTKLTSQQIKTEKSKRKTEKSKRKTESVNRAATKQNLAYKAIELNQSAQRLALDYAKFGLDQNINAWKEELERVKTATNQKDAETRAKKVENDLLVAAFKDPKLLAYWGLDTPEGQKAVKDTVNNLTKAKDKGVDWTLKNITSKLVNPPKGVTSFLNSIKAMRDKAKGKVDGHSTGGQSFASNKKSTSKSKKKKKK